MRAMFTVTASLLICFGLLGCNRNQQTQAPAPVVAAAPVCNCPQQTASAAPIPAAAKHRHRHHHSWSAHENSSYSDSYSADAYSPPPTEAGGETEDGNDAYSAPSAVTAQADAAVWVDGYGRSHYGAAFASDDANPAAVAMEDVRRRSAPWHAYNSDCDRAR